MRIKTIAIGIIVLAATSFVAGCASGPERSADESRTYCLETLRYKRLVCTPERVPSATVEAEARLFKPEVNALTVIVVRNQWSDAVRAVSFDVDEVDQIVTLPRSFVRLRLAPGPHVLKLSRDGRSIEYRFQGIAGELLFVELAGSFYPWERPYHWSSAEAEGIRERALRSRLIATVDRY